MILQVIRNCLIVIMMSVIFQNISNKLSFVPKKYHITRRLQHIASGISILLLLFFGGNYQDLRFSSGAGFGFILLIDIIRFNHNGFQKAFIKNMDKIIRPQEEKTLLGSTYFLLSVFICNCIFSYKTTLVSVVNLTFGDPFAALFGIYFRDQKTIFKTKTIDDKNIGGSLVAAFICAVVNIILNNLVA